MNLFLFHRDLRLIDNTALIRQLRKYKQITPIFIFNPVQIEPKRNSYFCHNSVQFMTQCLKELEQDIEKLNGKMYYFYGHNLEVLRAIHQTHKISSIYYNYDYTPFAKSRDQEIEEWAQSQKIEVVSTEDYVLYPILEGQTKNPKTDNPYLVFTPYKNHCMAKLKVRGPDNFQFASQHFYKNPALESLKCYFQSQDMKHLFESNQHIKVRGGRKQGLQILNSIKKFQHYNQQRNLPAVQTTNLSAYLHFTPISIRQVFQKVVAELGMQNNLINQLHWRDFYVNITHYFPRVLAAKNNSFQPKFDNIKWRYNEEQLNAWKEGRTGFPIVDAGMRQLNTTGFMHNRTRMIVASFLAKDLFLDWHQGQRYFSSKLVDVSPMQNSGGWQWTVGNGADAQGYYRIFNPWLQQKNYDPECTYIKRWIPELRDVPIEDIHKWEKLSKVYRKKGVNYPNPILDHETARKQTVQTFDKFLKKQQWKQKQV